MSSTGGYVDLVSAAFSPELVEAPVIGGNTRRTCSLLRNESA